MSSTQRCGWCCGHADYEDYHDREWGVPVHDDQKWFEFLTLETFQAGLSWLTILRKRENFRKAFDGFDVECVARYNSDKIKELFTNKGIVRNRLKIQAAVTNAQAFLGVQKKYGSFDSYIWAFVNHKPIQNRFKNLDEIPTKTGLSDTISASLKNHGFKFVGSTIVYAHMQATGMVNDHLTSCYRYNEVKALGQMA